MAVVGALNQLVSGLHSGFGAGMEAGEQVLEKYSGRKMGQAEAKLEEYMNYDFNADPGGAIGPDGEQQPMMTISDLNLVRSEYHDAARLTNDPEWSEKADQRWSDRLSKGVGSMMDQAMRQLEGGNHASAAKAIERAGSLVPNGIAYQVQTNEKGELVMSGYNELTGEPEDDKVMTPRDLARLRTQLTNPETAHELYTALEAEASGKRAAYAEAQRQSRLDVIDLAKKESEIAKNMADKHLKDRTNPNRMDSADFADISLKVQTLVRQVGMSMDSAGWMNTSKEMGAVINGMKPQLMTLANSRALEVLNATGDVDIQKAYLDAGATLIRYNELKRTDPQHPLIAELDAILGEPLRTTAVPER